MIHTAAATAKANLHKCSGHWADIFVTVIAYRLRIGPLKGPWGLSGSSVHRRIEDVGSLSLGPEQKWKN